MKQSSELDKSWVSNLSREGKKQATGEEEGAVLCPVAFYSQSRHGLGLFPPWSSQFYPCIHMSWEMDWDARVSLRKATQGADLGLVHPGEEEAFPTLLHLTRSVNRSVKSLTAEREAHRSKFCCLDLSPAHLQPLRASVPQAHPRLVHWIFGIPPGLTSWCSGIFSPVSTLGKGHQGQTLGSHPMPSSCHPSLPCVAWTPMQCHGSSPRLPPES